MLYPRLGAESALGLRRGGRSAHAAVAQGGEERIEVVVAHRKTPSKPRPPQLASDVGELAALERLEQADLADVLELLRGLLEQVVGALFDDSPRLEGDLSGEAAARLKDVLRVL